MTENSAPAPHEDPWVDVLRGYVTKAVEDLTQGGLRIECSWLDPRNPRDATIIFSHPAANVSPEKLALVWDEVSGWRRGLFESGCQGVRTRLSGTCAVGAALALPNSGQPAAPTACGLLSFAGRV